jgi:hypothetical protein
MRAAIAIIIAALAGAASAETRTRPFVGITAEEAYDSNVMNSRGADMVSRVVPRAGILHDSRRTTFLADYRVALHAYLRGVADNSVNHRAALGVRSELSRRLTISGGAVLLIADDPVLLERPAVAVPDGGFTDLVAVGRVEGEATRRIRLDAGYAFRRSTFEDEMASDGHEHQADAGLGWRRSRRVTIALRARGQRFVTEGVGSDHTFFPSAGMELRATRRLRFDWHAGPTWFLGQDLTWGGDARLVYLTRATRWTLGVSRELYGATGATGAIWNDSVQAGMFWRAARRVGLRAQLGAFAQGAAPDGDTEVTGLLARADAVWQVRPDLQLDLFIEQRAQDADGGLAFGDLHRTFVGVRLTGIIGRDLNEGEP